MDLAGLSDQELMGKVEALAETERFTMTDFLLHLGELDCRRTCERTSYATIFTYLTRRLHFSESDALRRVRAARAARRFPSILGMLARGELHLVGLSLLEPVLTSENHESLLRRASRRSTREIERMAADLSEARPGPRDRIRALPSSPSGGQAASGEEEAIFQALGSSLPAVVVGVDNPAGSVKPAPHGIPQNCPAASERPRQRVVFTFTADEEVRNLFERARDFLRHKYPFGRLEEVIGEALRQLIDRKDPVRHRLRRGSQTRVCLRGAFEKPGEPGGRPARRNSRRSRNIPARVRNEVWRRDGGRCAYVGSDGARCGAKAWLELDHVLPWAAGGSSLDPANIRILCRVHNQAEGRRWFGGKNPGGGNENAI